MMQKKKALEAIFTAGVMAVDPEKAVRRYVRRQGRELFVGECSYRLDDFKRILVIGAGKGAAPMASALEDILGPYLSQGWIVVKYGHGMLLHHTDIMEAGHPIPDEAGMKATKEILKQTQKCTDTDMIICVLSGGGSALMPAPSPPPYP